MRKRPSHRHRGGLLALTAGVSRLLRSPPIPLMRQLLNVVDQTVQFPLSIALRSPAQRKAVQPCVIAQVAEDRLHRREAARNHLFAPGAVDLAFHPRGMCLGLASRRP